MDSLTVRDLYGELAVKVRPIVLAHAKKISGALGIPMDDAIQEVQIALYKGMCKYDYNRSHGNLHRFADVILRNCAASIIHGEGTTRRVPHVVYKEDGQLKVAKYKRMATIEDLAGEGFEPSDAEPSPEDIISNRELEDRRARLRMRLVNRLNERELAVFKCMATPAEAFLIYLKNIGEGEPSNTNIARYLGLGKNSVDYATLTIRTKFTKLAEQEFPELIRGHLDRGTWPMIHVSREPRHDQEFVAQIIRERRLDPRPNEPARDIEMVGDHAREIQHYPWGVVLVLKRGKTYRTLVIEGRFNPISGGVNGADGTWKNVSEEVPWYLALVRRLGQKDG